MGAHLAQNDRLTGEQRALLASERETLGGSLERVATATNSYRGWLETAHVGLRAELRVADYLADEDQSAADGALRPHRDAVARALPGGFPRVFSDLPLSRVLRAGRDRTAALARTSGELVAHLATTTSIPGLAELGARLLASAGRIEALLHRGRTELEPQRMPLKLAVERAVVELREGLEKMDARLRERFPAAFIESLYPELSRNAAAVAGEPDDHDDDDTEPPAPPPVD